MSNPGVIYLSSHLLSDGKEFRVEDNIGEAIHIHYGDEIRLDLSVDQLLNMDEKVDEWIECILEDTNFKISYFDPIFLDMISGYLIDLKSVRIEKVMLEDLLVETKGFLGLPVMRSIKKSRIVKSLHGNSKELLEYQQENPKGISNLDRVDNINKVIQEKGYPFDQKYIVLFNDQNIIRDGQHRAGCLYVDKGNCEIDVIRMHFEDDKYNLSKHPWLNSLFVWNKKRIKHKVKSLCKKLVRRAQDFKYRVVRWYVSWLN